MTDLRVKSVFPVTRRAFFEGSLAAGSLAFARGQEIPLGAKQELSSPNPALVLARELNRTKFGDLPPTAIKYAKMILASTLASAASGSLIGSSRIVRELVEEHGGRPEATVWFGGAKLPAGDVARVNAVFSDSAASDDSDLRTIAVGPAGINVAHIGTTAAATGLAVGERTGAAGADLLCAIVTGYEAGGRLIGALGSGLRGFHASVIAAFGGVVTTARLLKLTDEQFAHAIGITATTMGGLAIGTNSWAREYHAGNAALCAVNAVLAASRGYTVNEDMLEGRGGFLGVFGTGNADPKILTHNAGKEWDIVKFMAVKLAPSAHPFQPTAEAAANASRQAGVPMEQVARILVSGSQGGRIVGVPRPPDDLVEAIHSVPYCVASAVADKDFSWVHATPEKIHSPIVARLIRLVEADPAPPPIHYDWGWGGTVTVVTKAGTRYTSTVDAPRGSGPRGIEWSDVDAKYHALLPGSHLASKRIEESLDLIHNFDKVKQVSELTHLLH